MVPNGPLVRRDGREFIVVGDAETLAGWLEPENVAESLRLGDYEIWDSHGCPVNIDIDESNGSVVLDLPIDAEGDESFRQKLAPLCVTDLSQLPSFDEIRLKLSELALPDFTVLNLWPDSPKELVTSSMDWHRPWEPRLQWTLKDGLSKIPIWKRF